MQMITSTGLDTSFGEYLLTTFKSCRTAGGVLFGVILYPLHYITHTVATYVIISIALVILSAFVVDRIVVERKNLIVLKPQTNNSVYINQSEIEEDSDEMEYEEVLASSIEAVEEENDDIFISDDIEEDEESSEIDNVETKKSDIARDILLGSNANAYKSRESSRDNSYIDKLESFSNNEQEDNEDNISNKFSKGESRPNIYVHEDDFEPYSPKPKVEEKVPTKSKKELEDEERRKNALEYLNINKGKFETKTKKIKGFSNIEEPKVTETPKPTSTPSPDKTFANNPFADREEKKNDFKIDEGFKSGLTYKDFVKVPNELLKTNTDFNPIPKEAQKVYSGEVKDGMVDAHGPRPVQVSMNDPKPRPKPTGNVYRKPPVYNRPPIDLLRKYPSNIEQDTQYMEEKGNLIVETLRSFKIETKVINATKGPTFTRYELQMAPGYPVSLIGNKMNDLSMVLESSCRAQLPIVGKNAFGIEVPNKKRMTVGLRDIIESPAFQNSKSPLTFALGKDISNDCKVACVDKMVHTLVAGSTGSGKSVCLNTLLVSLLYKASPEDLRLLLVDPKTVEFSSFNNLPHMLIPNTITECDKAVDALSWLVEEMDNRYRRLNQVGAKKISEYNDSDEVKSGQLPKMFYIVMIFDEVGDFMVRAKKEIEEKIRLLAAKSRACGIHLILATQRPTVDVITGTIKANLPSRIAFAVASAIDSKTILESSGAEYLLGMGDMLYIPSGSNDLDRIQGCFVDNDELKAVLKYVKENNPAEFDETIEDAMFNKKDVFDSNNSAEEVFDPQLKECLKYFIKAKKVSTSSLQARFGMGYPKASKIIMQMEKAGFVSPPDSNSRRNLYITPQEFEERFGEGINE